MHLSSGDGWVACLTSLTKRLALADPSKTHAEEGADAPFDVVYCKPVLIADVGEVEYHGQAEELVAPLSYGSPSTGDDDLG